MKIVTALAAILSLPASGIGADSYQVDPVHSFILMRVKHLDVSHAWGRFNDFSGTIQFDDADPSKSSVEFEIKAASIDTGNAKRDEHLRGPDFFNAKQFPVITFKSTEVKKDDEGRYDVKGNLTIRGITKPVEAEFEMVGQGKNPDGTELAGGDAHFKVKRSDFDITFAPQALGDEVLVKVSVEARKKN